MMEGKFLTKEVYLREDLFPGKAGFWMEGICRTERTLKWKETPA